MILWLIVQAVGIIDNVCESVMSLEINQMFIVTVILETYFWCLILSLYQEFKANENPVVVNRDQSINENE